MRTILLAVALGLAGVSVQPVDASHCAGGFACTGCDVDLRFPSCDREEGHVHEHATQVNDESNKNGPAVDDRRPVPAQSDIPRLFRDLSDILASTASLAGFPGPATLDHQTAYSGVDAGLRVPANYWSDNLAGRPHTPPASTHFLWHGYWSDVNGDGRFFERDCAQTPYQCDPADELVWRGANTGEALVAYAYVFPGDYDGGSGTGSKVTPSGLAGDCVRWGSDNPDCIRGDADFAYTDRTAHVAVNRDMKGWYASDGGGQWTAEEFVLVSQHVVSIIGPPAMLGDGSYGAHVRCGPAEGCMRDYDWFAALAGDVVEALYLSTLRGVRDEVARGAVRMGALA